MYENYTNEQKLKLIESMYVQKVAFRSDDEISYPLTFDVELWKRFFFLCAMNDALVLHMPFKKNSEKEKKIYHLARELFLLAKENYLNPEGVPFEKIQEKSDELENFKRKTFKLNWFQKMIVSDLYYSYLSSKKLTNPEVRLSEYNFIATAALESHKYISSMKSMKRSFLFRVFGGTVTLLAIILSVIGIVASFR